MTCQPQSTTLTIRLSQPHRHIREGNDCFEDDKCSGHPHISRTAENIKKVSMAVRKNRLQTTAESVLGHMSMDT
ncbi:hypothetical protein TNCV_3107871 [Trichonephila clavipes]|uniref:Uncharacterized protein n=1 Tax=Trichonephila clavipes TaxID=2585209 RepID=A0A8X6SFN9_TRICX|nr:hypothetical protein TNCV_3107871 [Trichonephila clavipes]